MFVLDIMINDVACNDIVHSVSIIKAGISCKSSFR